MSVNTTPATWAAGEFPTATKLNTEIRDFATGVQAAWTAWTPTWTNVTVGNGVVVARYMQVGHTIYYRLSLTAGSTTTFSASTLSATLPVAARSDYIIGEALGSGQAFDSSVGNTSRTGLTAALTTGSTLFWLVDRLSSSAAVTSTVPWTWATGDQLTASGQYEAA